jgi:hypothetical protein
MAGINVVAVANDSLQFKSLQAHFTKLAADEEKALDAVKNPKRHVVCAQTRKSLLNILFWFCCFDRSSSRRW